MKYVYFAVTIVLFAITLVIANTAKENPPPEQGKVRLVWGNSNKILDADFMRNLNTVKAKYNDFNVEGYVLKNLIESATNNFNDYNDLLVLARDGYQSKISKKDMDSKVLLILAEFDKANYKPSTSKIGIAFTEDEYMHRWVKDIYEIRLLK
ncbi:MAG: hypothetical protein JXA60_11390 [Candidatus Coatesbacteria bacterium]|nr:hypothetical protein [Candidatus Coatesbacteria bacterium]